jgi:hypothetical protein
MGDDDKDKQRCACSKKSNTEMICSKDCVNTPQKLSIRENFFYNKYLKYKNKYLQLKNQSGGVKCNVETCAKKVCSALKQAAIENGVKTLEEMIAGLNEISDDDIRKLGQQECPGCDNEVNELINQFNSDPRGTVEYAWNNC